MLTVEAEVLREGLRGEQLEALVDEVAQRGGVFVDVAWREALVGAVEEHKQLLALRVDANDGSESPANTSSKLSMHHKTLFWPIGHALNETKWKMSFYIATSRAGFANRN